MADIQISDTPAAFKNLSMKKRRAASGEADLYQSRLVRIRIPVAVTVPGAEISMKPLCSPDLHGHVISAITVDPRRIGRPYRYAYGNCVAGARPCNAFNAVCRVDVTDGSVLTWNDSPNVIISGPIVFVPRPSTRADDETDGVLLVDGLGADGRSVIVLLSGRTFTEFARVVVPYRHTVSCGTTWVWDREAISRRMKPEVLK